METEAKTQHPSFDDGEPTGDHFCPNDLKVIMEHC